MVKHYCDKCKKEASNTKIATLKVPTGEFGEYAIREYSVQFELCKECFDKLELTPLSKDASWHNKPDAKDRLYEIVRELVAECIN